MKRFVGVAALSLVLLVAGCRGRTSKVVIEDEAPDVMSGPASSVRMGDPAATAQLTKGFHAVEGGAWRWTAGHFSLMLKTPLGAAKSGGLLTFAFTIPAVVIERNKALTLSASTTGADGKPVELSSQKYTAAGSYTFGADVPAAALGKETVTIDFALDKSLAPSPQDGRELGVIATAAGIESK